jgi:hypothetical protein
MLLEKANSCQEYRFKGDLVAVRSQGGALRAPHTSNARLYWNFAATRRVRHNLGGGCWDASIVRRQSRLATSNIRTI